MTLPTCRPPSRHGLDSAPSNWLADARRAPLPDVVSALGFELHANGRSFGPCPNCGMASRANPGRTDRRGRCRIEADGKHWACCSNGTDGCGAKGDSVALVVCGLVGRPWQKGDSETSARIRDWFAARGWCQPFAPSGRQRAAAAPSCLDTPAARPSAQEMHKFWPRLVSVMADRQVSAWLAGRADGAIDPAVVAALGLARALPADLPDLPCWARFKGRPWTQSGHRLIVQAWEPDPERPGRLRWASLHARNVLPGCDPADKAAWPAGASAAGLVLATGPDPRAHGMQLVELAEGVPDWLRQALNRAARCPEGNQPAVWGVLSGSACANVAAVVPRGWPVAIRTHDDEAGQKYAERWRQLLVTRGCKVHMALVPNRAGGTALALDHQCELPASPAPVPSDAELMAAACDAMCVAVDPTAVANTWFWGRRDWGLTDDALATFAGARDARLSAMDSREFGEYRAQLRILEDTWLPKK